MSSKLRLKKPVLIILYGFPGAGKTFLARGLSQEIEAAHVHGDRIRSELPEGTANGSWSDKAISNLSQYMAGEFLSAGTSVIYDADSSRFKKRRILRDMARSLHAEPLLVWLQIDTDTALARASNRDKRRIDDRFNLPIDKLGFDRHVSHMQNPNRLENPMVVSGKHTYKMVRQIVFKRLLELGLVDAAGVSSKIAKPSLVNLVPGARSDDPRRNIVIR